MGACWGVEGRDLSDGRAVAPFTERGLHRTGALSGVSNFANVKIEILLPFRQRYWKELCL